MANPNGTEVVQVELQHETTHTVIWVTVVLRPVKGMILICGKDPRRWTVIEAYTKNVIRMENINSDWKVGGL